MTRHQEDYLIARALCIAAGAEETEQADADRMLDLLIDRFPALARAVLHENRGTEPGLHLRVLY